MEGMERGRPCFGQPPQELLPKLAFEPSTVKERGWLLLYNALLSTTFSLLEPTNVRVNRGLQWNTWTIMEDASIFLEPSEVKIQAICMVAAHGQEIISPNLCWNLINHACRMAQSLSLHLPSSHAPLGSEANLQRNFLFWGIFILDKNLSFAFGRPPFLPSNLYKNVPPPEPVELGKFKPHLIANSVAEKRPSGVDYFGGIYVTQTRALALIQGQIFHALNSEDNVNSHKIACLISEVEAAMETMKKVQKLCPLLVSSRLIILLGNLQLYSYANRHSRD
jgi:hypothetical protein